MEVRDFLMGMMLSLYENDERLLKDKLKNERDELFDLTRESTLADPVLDVPEILSEVIKKRLYGTFNQLSYLCGTGELSLHYYTEIKCSKFTTVFEDGIGLSTLFILQALVENFKQKQHYNNNNTSNIMLDDSYYKQTEVTRFYVNCRNTDQQYLAKLKIRLNEINHDKCVKIIYINDKQYNDTTYMNDIFRQCQFINLDNGRSIQQYWPSCFSYYGFDKLICFHHLGYLYPLVNVNKLNELLTNSDYSVALYPVIEKNKKFQSGCLKIMFVNKD